MKAYALEAPRLSGTWLVLARALWCVSAAVALIVILASIPGYVVQLGTFTEAERSVLQSFLNISPELVAPYDFAKDLASAFAAVMTALFCFLLAVILFRRKSNEPIALFVSFFLLAFGVLINSPIETLTQWLRPELFPLVLTAEGLLTIFSMPLLFLVFPDGRFVPRWTRWIALAMVPWAVAIIAFPAVQPMQNFDTTSVFAQFAWYIVPIAVALVAQVYRYLRVSTPIQRQQTKWVIVGFLAWLLSSTTVPLALLLIFRYFIGPPVSGDELSLAWLIVLFIGFLAWPVSLIIIPCSIAIAVLRYRLWDIDNIIRRTVSYTIVVAILVSLYFGSIILLQQIFAVVSGQRSEVITVLSTLAIAALFVPLRNRIQSWIDQQFYRHKYDAQKVLQQFAETVRDETDLEELTRSLAHVMNETMQPKSMSVWLKPADNSTPRR